MVYKQIKKTILSKTDTKLQLSKLAPRCSMYVYSGWLAGGMGWRVVGWWGGVAWTGLGLRGGKWGGGAVGGGTWGVEVGLGAARWGWRAGGWG